MLSKQKSIVNSSNLNNNTFNFKTQQVNNKYLKGIEEVLDNVNIPLTKVGYVIFSIYFFLFIFLFFFYSYVFYIYIYFSFYEYFIVNALVFQDSQLKNNMYLMKQVKI